MSDNDARERVAEAVHNVNPWWEMNGDPKWPDLPAEMKHNVYERADAAIAAHSAYLWERALDPATVEAVERTIYDVDPVPYRIDASLIGSKPFEERGMARTIGVNMQARAAITALLTALLGPRPEGDTE